jgi:hypothetical protein
MDQPTVPLLPGQIIMALVLAAVLAYPLARLLLWRYVRAVERAMRSASPQAASAETAMPIERPRAAFAGARDALMHQLQRAPWRSAAIQVVLALLLAGYFCVLQLHSGGIDMSVYRMIVLSSTLLWPGMLAVLIIAGISPRQRVMILLVGAALYLAVGVWAHTGGIGQAIKEIFLLWVYYNLPATLYLLVLLARRVRAVGPLVWLVTLTTVGGVETVFALGFEFPNALQAVATVLFDLGFGAIGVLLTFALVGGAVALLLGVWLLRQLVKAYARYSVGDEGLILAALWLTFILIRSSSLALIGPGYFLLGLAAFPMYLVGVRVARKVFLPAASADAPALLLLRVFARKGRTAGLFRAINRHWRHVGPMRMIAGYDLASEAIEPDELMAFLRGRLADSFVTGPEVVRRRLGGKIPQRDADARYRSEEFFCFDNTWRDTLQQLVANSAVILMDLRGFGPNNTGCIFELKALAGFGALPRTVLLHDATTDTATLHEALSKLGVDVGALELLTVHGDEARDIPALLGALAKRVAG